MAFETPERVDLSNQDDIAKLKANLTPAEHARLNEYFSQEKEGIIYLTQEELGDLKQALKYENNHHRDRNEVIDEFIAEQKAEWFSLSDILEWQEWIPENIDTIDALAHDFLFWENGVCKDMYLSETAQDHFAGWFSLALVEFISEQEDLNNLIDENGKLQLSENLLQALEKSMPTLLILWELSRKMIIVETPVGSQENKSLDLLGNGETNSVIMNLWEGKDFFLKILSWEFDAVKMEEILEAGNNSDNIKSNSGEIQTRLLEQVRDIQEKISTPDVDPKDLPQTWTDISETLVDAQTAIDTAATPEEKSIWEQFLKLLEKFLQGFIWIADWNNKDNVENNKVKAKENKEKIKQDNSLIEMIDALSQNNTDFVDALRKDPQSTRKIRLILESISPDETFEETLKDLFSWNIVMNMKWIKVWNIFDTYGFGASLPEGLNQIQITIKALEEYSRYRNAPGVKWLSSWRITWEKWAQKRQAENWKV